MSQILSVYIPGTINDQLDRGLGERGRVVLRSAPKYL